MTVAAGPSSPPVPSRAAGGDSCAVARAEGIGRARPATAAGVHQGAAHVRSREPGFGQRLLARIVDAQSGAVLYDSFGDTPAAPASTGKLLTAAAILGVHPPSYRFPTTVVDGGHGTIVIVGGGDPTLSAAPKGTAPLYPGAARMSDLVAAVQKSGVTVRRIEVDDSRFAGPSISPQWDPERHGDQLRRPDHGVLRRRRPPLADRAGAQRRAARHRRGERVRRPARASRTCRSRTARHRRRRRCSARVESAPLSELITEMLQESDNIIAEILARQVAVAEHVRASFNGATAAIRTVLARFGVQVGGGMKDGSGLSSYDRVSPAALVGVLRLVAGATGPPAAAQLHFIAGALPVAGWSGTLADRYTSGSLAADAGRVRAKTGTLSTVASLAGFVRDKSGRLLIFSLDSDRAINTFAADAAMDDVVGALAKCGC